MPEVSLRNGLPSEIQMSVIDALYLQHVVYQKLGSIRTSLCNCHLRFLFTLNEDAVPCWRSMALSLVSSIRPLVRPCCVSLCDLCELSLSLSLENVVEGRIGHVPREGAFLNVVRPIRVVEEAARNHWVEFRQSSCR